MVILLPQLILRLNNGISKCVIEHVSKIRQVEYVGYFLKLKAQLASGRFKYTGCESVRGCAALNFEDFERSSDSAIAQRSRQKTVVAAIRRNVHLVRAWKKKSRECVSAEISFVYNNI